MGQPLKDESDYRRRLLLIPVRDYPDADDEFRDGIDEQIHTAVTWWNPTGDRPFEIARPTALASRRDIENFVHDTGLREAKPGDVLVIYVTGHGYRAPSGSHVLVMPNGADDRIVRDGYPTEDLVLAAMHSDAEHILVIINTCFAHAIADSLQRKMRDLPEGRRKRLTLAVICSADFDQRPRVREFSTWLRRAYQQLRRSAGIAREELTIEEFLQELTRAARSDPAGGDLVPLRAWPPMVCDTPTPCLPNPGYQPADDVVEPARRQVASGAAELDFWLDRASGRTGADDGGWYFTGRSELTTQVAQFLAGDAGVLVVTGMAGTGKSAIIARAVTLSDPAFRDDPRYRAGLTHAPPSTVPDVGSIDVAVQARNKDTAELLEQILTGLGATPSPVAAGADRTTALREQAERALTANPRSDGRPVMIVLDGLDEAKQPVRVITDLIGPLARATGPGQRRLIRWLIGIRSPRPDTTATTPEAGLLDLLLRATHSREPQLIRTDGPDVRDDIAAYVAALLAAGHGRDGTDAAARTEASHVIAEHVAPSFLDARLAAARRRNQTSPPPLDDPQWLASLDDGTVGQLRLDLRDEAADASADELLALLRASAFALGDGVPWADIWPAMASAILGRPLADADATIERLLSGRLSGYLQRGTEDGRVVYRPAHQRLGEILREQAHTLIGEPQ